MLLSSVIYGQAPKIEIKVTSIHEEINADDSVLIKIPIKNVGNRDLLYYGMLLRLFRKSDFQKLTMLILHSQKTRTD